MWYLSMHIYILEIKIVHGLNFILLKIIQFFVWTGKFKDTLTSFYNKLNEKHRIISKIFFKKSIP